VAKKKTDEDLIELPCSFGSTNNGKKTACVRVSVSRDHLKLPIADKTLCDRRLTVTLIASDDQPGQARLPGMEADLKLEGVADSKAVGVHADHYTFGLTFGKKELRAYERNHDINFGDFAGRDGKLLIAGVEEIPAAEKNGDAEEVNDAGEE
jgi:hypothetical protein